jgi:branched-chain amino acid transport system permease protein
MTSAVLSTSPRGPKQSKSIAERLQPFAWPIGYVIVIVLLFIFYNNILPNLSASAVGHVNDWLPITAINEALVWVSMALGLNIVVGYAGLLDLGYVAFWAIGGYVAGWLMSAPWDHGLKFSFLAPPGVVALGGVHISFWLVLIASGFVCVLAGIIIGAPTLRLRGDYLALVTLGFGEMIRQLAQNGKVAGFNLTNGDAGIPAVDPIGTGPAHQIFGLPRKLGPFDTSYKLIVLALIVAACLFISLRIRGGRLGRAWLAIREDELAASMMGVSLVKTKLSAYAVGAFFGGLGGVAYASGITGAVSPSKFDFSISITVLLMVVLGGMGNVWGVMIGALILSWVNSTGLNQIGVTWDNITGRHDASNFKANQFGLFGIVLVLMMLFRREGILPERRMKALMSEPSRELADHLGVDITEAEQESEFVQIEAEVDAANAAAASADDGTAP